MTYEIVLNESLFKYFKGRVKDRFKCDRCEGTFTPQDVICRNNGSRRYFHKSCYEAMLY
jgi:hypothetical protein